MNTRHTVPTKLFPSISPPTPLSHLMVVIKPTSTMQPCILGTIPNLQLQAVPLKCSYVYNAPHHYFCQYLKFISISSF